VRFSVDPPADGNANMSADRGLLDRAEAGELSARLYSWSSAWVTLGRFQDPERDLLPSCPIPATVRPTGGRGVLHGHDITVVIAVPLRLLGPEVGSRTVKRAYRLVVGPIIDALRASGIAAQLGEESQFGARTPRSADCFAHVAANDVVDQRTGSKVCGCALRLTESAVLLQASIPVGQPLIEPAQIFRDPAATAFVVLDPKAFGQCLFEAASKLGAICGAIER
jgi:lipoate-protein ligase A